MHYRHFIHRLIHDLRRFGGGVITWTLLLFIFGVFVYWPFTAILGDQAGSSLVGAVIIWLIYGKMKAKRNPG